MSNAVAEYLRGQADWRRDVAERYPDDLRNLQSARALDSLAEYAEDEDEEVQHLVDALDPFVMEGGLGGQETARAVSRYGYGYPVSTAQHEEMLEEMAVLCLVDSYESAMEHEGDDPTGVLLPAETEAARDRVYLPRRYFERRDGSQEHELEEVIASYREADDAS